MAVVESDFDIYGDLDDALQPLTAENKEVPIPEPEEDKVSEVLIELQKENEKLKNENVLLTKNVSILLLTAKAEIERKDNQIKELRKEKDEIVFRKFKKNVHTAEKWSQTSSNSTRDSGSQTLGDKIDNNQRSNRDSKDYNKRPRSKERRSSRDEKSRRRSRSRDRRKRSRSSSRNNRHGAGRNNEKRPRINYPSSTESTYSQSKSKSTEDILKDKPKVLGAYEDLSPIKRQCGDTSMHLYPTVPIELKSSRIANPIQVIPVNGNHLKEAVPVKLNFDSSEVIVEPVNAIKTKTLVESPQNNTSNDCKASEKLPIIPKEAITTVVVPLAPMCSIKTEIKLEPNGLETPLLISKQETAVIPIQEVVATLKSPVAVVKPSATVRTPRDVVKSPVTAVKTPATIVKSPITFVKSPAAVRTPLHVVKSPVKSPVVVIKSKPPSSPVNAIKSEPPSSPVISTKVSKEIEQKVTAMNSPQATEKVQIKVESTSPVVWENSNSTYRKEIVDGTEVIKIVRKPRIKKRKNVVN